MQRPSDEELIAVVEKIAKRLARIYKFGCHEIEDLTQQCYVEALKSMDKYDGERPLVNFLSIHLRNRLYNFKRDNHARISSPCEKCPLGAWVKKTDSCKLYEFREDCQLYYKWVVINTDKRNLSQPVHMGDSDVENGGETDIVAFRDIQAQLRDKLSADGQQIMFKIMNGDKVKPSELKRFREEAQGILNNEG